MHGPWKDPREYQRRGHERMAPDRGSLGEELDDLDGSAIWADDDEADDRSLDYLEQSPERGVFPHDA
jgi:hypothetical protein